MHSNCCKHLTILERVGHLLDAMKSINRTQLEKLVQDAHECDIHQLDTPSEPFPVSRQALRMFWLFRNHIDSVNIRPEATQ